MPAAGETIRRLCTLSQDEGDISSRSHRIHMFSPRFRFEYMETGEAEELKSTGLGNGVEGYEGCTDDEQEQTWKPKAMLTNLRIWQKYTPWTVNEI